MGKQYKFSLFSKGGDYSNLPLPLLKAKTPVREGAASKFKVTCRALEIRSETTLLPSHPFNDVKLFSVRLGNICIRFCVLITTAKNAAEEPRPCGARAVPPGGAASPAVPRVRSRDRRVGLTYTKNLIRDLNKKKVAESANTLKDVKSSEINSSLSCLLSSRLVSR